MTRRPTVLSVAFALVLSACGLGTGRGDIELPDDSDAPVLHPGEPDFPRF